MANVPQEITDAPKEKQDVKVLAKMLICSVIGVFSFFISFLESSLPCASEPIVKKVRWGSLADCELLEVACIFTTAGMHSSSVLKLLL